jgi:hypothetical protein
VGNCYFILFKAMKSFSSLLLLSKSSFVSLFIHTLDSKLHTSSSPPPRASNLFFLPSITPIHHCVLFAVNLFSLSSSSSSFSLFPSSSFSFSLQRLLRIINLIQSDRISIIFFIILFISTISCLSIQPFTQIQISHLALPGKRSIVF